MAVNVEEITFVVVLTLGEEIIVKFEKRSRDRFAKKDKRAKMENAHRRVACVNATKAGLGNSVISERISEEEVQQNHQKLIKEIFFFDSFFLCDINNFETIKHCKRMRKNLLDCFHCVWLLIKLLM
jgi:hypothetical protein